MVEKFTIGLHGQREWAWLLALYLFFGSMGGCLYILYQIFHLSPVFALVSLGLVLLGGGMIWFKLGSPQRVWRAIFRPTTSWISRGILFVGSFLVLGALSVAPQATAWFPGLSPLPWSEASTLGQSLSWAASAFGLLTAIYPGFVVSNSRAIPFWNTPILPVLFFAYAATGAVGVVLIGSPKVILPIIVLAACLIMINLALLSVYLFAMNQAGGSAQESVRRLNQVPLGAVFWIGVIVIGLLFPLAAVICDHWLPLTWGRWLPLAGICLLFGGLLLRYCVLKAGVYVPPTIASEKQNFSKLNRASANLEQEYRAWQIARSAVAQ